MSEPTRYKTKAPVGVIDREQGIIYGVSIITANREASGHGVYIDETFIEQVLDQAKAKEPTGLKCRFDHPNACARSMGTFVGRFHEFRRDDSAGKPQIRGDLHIAAAAEKSPDGDLRTYILDLAEEDPSAFATSIVFRPADSYVPDKAEAGKNGNPPEDDPYWMPHVRLKVLRQCDVVDEGAANDGIYGRPNYIAEQFERFASEHLPTLSRVFQRVRQYDAETSQGDTGMKELEAITKERDELTAQVKELTAKADEQFEAGVDQGRDEVHGTIKARMELFDQNADFVILTLGETDAEAQKQYLAKLKESNKELTEQLAAATSDKPGSPAVETSSDGNDGSNRQLGKGAAADPEAVQKWKTAVKEIQDNEGVSKGKALSIAAKRHSELHAAYVKATQPAGGNADD